MDITEVFPTGPPRGLRKHGGCDRRAGGGMRMLAEAAWCGKMCVCVLCRLWFYCGCEECEMRSKFARTTQRHECNQTPSFFYVHSLNWPQSNGAEKECTISSIYIIMCFSLSVCLCKKECGSGRVCLSFCMALSRLERAEYEIGNAMHINRHRANTTHSMCLCMFSVCVHYARMHPQIHTTPPHTHWLMCLYVDCL